MAILRPLLLLALCGPWPLLPGMAAGSADTGTGGGPAAPGAAAASAAGPATTRAALQAAYRQQMARCQALQVVAVRAECQRQAERDLALGLAALKSRKP